MVIRDQDAQKGPGQMKHQRDTPSVPPKAWLYLLKFLEHPKLLSQLGMKSLTRERGRRVHFIFKPHLALPVSLQCLSQGPIPSCSIKGEVRRNSELFSVVTEQIRRYTLRFLLTTPSQLRTIHLTDVDERKKNRICQSQMWL